jgi:hypothetical protein
MSKSLINRGLFLTAASSILAACSGSIRGSGVATVTPSELSESKWSVPASIQGHPILDINFIANGTQNRVHAQFVLAALPLTVRSGSMAQLIPSIAPVSRSVDGAAINRDAGIIILNGFRPSTVAVGQSGSLVFEPNEAYQQQLNGVGLTISPDQQLSLSLANVSVDDFRLLRSVYPSASVVTMLAIRHMGFSASDAVALKSQRADLTANQMLRELSQSGNAAS